MPCKFLQIHSLTSFAASLLNRDDAGFAKRMPFGGAVRTRISSQCLKRHWRMYDGENALRSINAPESIRSRESFERYVVEPLVADGVSVDVARAATEKIVSKLLGSEAKKERIERKAGKKKNVEDTGPGPSDDKVRTPQVTVLGRPELDYLCQLAREAVREAGGKAERIDVVIDTKMKSEKFRKKYSGPETRIARGRAWRGAFRPNGNGGHSGAYGCEHSRRACDHRAFADDRERLLLGHR